MKHSLDGVTLDIKRCYLPSFAHEEACPKCGEMVTWDGDEQYVSYPTIGVSEPLFMYCNECDEEWNCEMLIDMSVEVLDK